MNLQIVLRGEGPKPTLFSEIFVRFRVLGATHEENLSSMPKSTVFLSNYMHHSVAHHSVLPEVHKLSKTSTLIKATIKWRIQGRYANQASLMQSRSVITLNQIPAKLVLHIELSRSAELFKRIAR
jgi:hypothetical protein